MNPEGRVETRTSVSRLRVKRRQTSSFLALLDLLHLAGLVHHLAVDHGLGDDFDDLPRPYIGFFCDTELNRSNTHFIILVYWNGI